MATEEISYSRWSYPENLLKDYNHFFVQLSGYSQRQMRIGIFQAHQLINEKHVFRCHLLFILLRENIVSYVEMNQEWSKDGIDKPVKSYLHINFDAAGIAREIVMFSSMSPYPFTSDSLFKPIDYRLSEKAIASGLTLQKLNQSMGYLEYLTDSDPSIKSQLSFEKIVDLVLNLDPSTAAKYGVPSLTVIERSENHAYNFQVPGPTPFSNATSTFSFPTTSFTTNANGHFMQLTLNQNILPTQQHVQIGRPLMNDQSHRNPPVHLSNLIQVSSSHSKDNNQFSFVPSPDKATNSHSLSPPPLPSQPNQQQLHTNNYLKSSNIPTSTSCTFQTGNYPTFYSKNQTTIRNYSSMTNATNVSPPQRDLIPGNSNSCVSSNHDCCVSSQAYVRSNSCTSYISASNLPPPSNSLNVRTQSLTTLPPSPNNFNSSCSPESKSNFLFNSTDYLHTSSSNVLNDLTNDDYTDLLSFMSNPNETDSLLLRDVGF